MSPLNYAIGIVVLILIVWAVSGILGIIDGGVRAWREKCSWDRKKRAMFQRNIRELIEALSLTNDPWSAGMLRGAFERCIETYRGLDA